MTSQRLTDINDLIIEVITYKKHIDTMTFNHKLFDKVIHGSWLEIELKDYLNETFPIPSTFFDEFLDLLIEHLKIERYMLMIGFKIWKSL